MRDYNPPALTELYAAVHEGTPTLRYLCANCSRWIVRVFALPTISLVAIREEVSIFDHELLPDVPRDGERIMECLAAMDVADAHPRASKRPFLTTIASLVSYQGDRTLTAFCCKSHSTTIDELATDLNRGIASRVSKPDTP